MTPTQALLPGKSIDSEVLRIDDRGVVLLGGRCGDCGTVTFPLQDTCPRCSASSMVSVELPSAGTLWSYTVQSFRPKRPFLGPDDFVPFGVGYIDLGPVIVETRLTINDPDQLEIGDPMTLTTMVNHRDADGSEVLTYAFGPSSTEETK
ncbi:Zn-ribbon domain-containing OB-fold protein [Rhodococcus koreensis]|uniref:Zn-ribbon domain-containing OB-fold protein n=1 Tax=Rhodococcus koreensis TaxID=99653 RepID=UPI00197E00C6|nr:OB-fold domain-containing protein [Rhodococcus koreensis]QSE85910.1 OB-fold domain-containing protein [Rhodococcus koreensis]